MDKFEGRYTVEEGESTTLIWAMQATFSLGYKKVIFEGENIHVNKCIKGQAFNLRLNLFIPSQLGRIILKQLNLFIGIKPQTHVLIY
ncbi:hypothetical protein DY000_02034343 [Brassica cretica]|uniref:RNase H type-1 domain-containing protein n=1 Tax=Brassica cretica TaxID=69181 RepID=A0ABQ7DXX5_BRACR|nr:hypothetical protein DY000_02034343 [Brassica cretica]